MKIAILMDAPLRKTLINEGAMQRLKKVGEIYLNETDKAEKATVLSIIKDADIAITSWGVPSFDEEILNAAPKLKFIAHAAGSVKSIVTDEMYKRNIKIISSARILSYGVSETALGLTICACKNVFAFDKSISKGGWVTDYSVINEMYGTSIGVIGCGFAGSHYIELLQPFGVNILVYDPGVSAEEIKSLGAKKAELSEIFTQSDVISLHAPSIAATNHIINKESLALMKQNVILINTARGSLVDEAALEGALVSGKLKYACLDVTEPEPPAINHPLRSIDNCIMTPHLAGCANNGKQKIGEHVADEIERFVAQTPLISEITQDMLATIA